MKTISGKGSISKYGSWWLAVVPDDATSCTDPRGTVITAPREFGLPSQGAYLEGYAVRVKDEQRIREGKTYGIPATKGDAS